MHGWKKGEVLTAGGIMLHMASVLLTSGKASTDTIVLVYSGFSILILGLIFWANRSDRKKAEAELKAAKAAIEPAKKKAVDQAEANLVMRILLSDPVTANGSFTAWPGMEPLFENLHREGRLQKLVGGRYTVPPSQSSFGTYRKKT
jgi:hypothetical protein